MSDERGTALELAGEIAGAIIDTAIVHEDQCTWMGTVQRAGAVQGTSVFSYESLGPDFYSGTSGVALFLAEWHRLSGDARAATVSAQAARFAVATSGRIHRKFRRAYYSGQLGIAHTVTRVGMLLRRDEFTAAANRELDRQLADDDDGILLDVISGAAGAIGPLLTLAHDLRRLELVAFAERLGDRIVGAATPTDRGWTWGEDATGFSTMAPLTGLGHGAAGMGWALLELFAATHHSRFRRAAQEAFRYEDSLFVASRDNWPDLRHSATTGDDAHHGVAWCLGAPGIGLTRIRAEQILGRSRQLTADLGASLRTILDFASRSPELGVSDFSLCHGWAGLGDILLDIVRHSPSADGDSLIARIIAEGASANRSRPRAWRCGMRRGSTPAMMLGLAGMGYFFLRVADPVIPSVLLVHPTVTR